MVDEKQIVKGMARCGLICALCQPEEICCCKGHNHYGKRLSPKGCYQYECSMEKGFEGCWECKSAPCDKDMHSPSKVKIRSFITCIKEEGLNQFAAYVAHNEANGFVYHREGIYGDYDLATEDEVLKVLRIGKK